MAKYDKDKKKSTNNGGRGKAGKGTPRESADTKSTNVGNNGSIIKVRTDTVGKVSFGHPMGSSLKLSEDTGTVITHTMNRFRLPGILRFGMLQTPVIGTTYESPLNDVIRDVFADIRASHSGSMGFMRADLGFYFMSAASLIDFHAYVARLAGLCGTDLAQNLYTPDQLMEAAGGDYNAYAGKKNQLVDYANWLAGKLGKIHVPNLEFFTRRYALLGNVYKDNDGPYASYYVFTPDAYWKFNFTNDPDTTGMVTVPAPGSSIEEIKAFGNELLNSIYNYEDFLGQISGAIKRVYGDNLFKPFLIDVNYTIAPVWDVAMLQQIHNATVIPNSQNNAYEMVKDWFIYEDKVEGSKNLGAMCCVPNIKFTHATLGSDQLRDHMMIYASGAKVFDTIVENPGSEEITVFCRFMFSTAPKQEGSTLSFDIITAGTEILTSCVLYSNPYSDGMPVTRTQMADVRMFDYSPYLAEYTFYDAKDGRITGVVGPRLSGEINNYGMVSTEMLKGMHRVIHQVALGQLT